MRILLFIVLCWLFSNCTQDKQHKSKNRQTSDNQTDIGNRETNSSSLHEFVLDSLSESLVLGITGQYFQIWPEELTGIFFTKEPCGLSRPFLSIYYADKNEPGYYVFDNFFIHAPVYITRASQHKDRIALTGLLTSGSFSSSNAPGEVGYSFRQLDSNRLIVKFEDTDSMFLIPEIFIGDYLSVPCTDFHAILNNLPREFLLLHQEEETEEYYVLDECQYGMSRLTFSEPVRDCDTCKPIFTLWDGGDSFDNEIDSIWKSADVIHIHYTAMGNRGLLRISQDTTIHGSFVFSYGDPGLNVYRLQEQYIPSGIKHLVKVRTEKCE